MPRAATPRTSEKTSATARGAATRAQLLDAAVALLADQGYAGLRIAALCQRVGVAPTAIYWHFGSKAGLMEAVIARIARGTVDRIRAEAAGVERPEERLDRVIAAIRELVTTQPLGSLTGVAVVGEGRHVTPELRGALRRAREREFALIADEFAAAVGGERRLAETLATLALACTNYAALAYRLDRDEADVDRILAGLRDAVVRLAGLRGSPPRRGRRSRGRR